MEAAKEFSSLNQAVATVFGEHLHIVSKQPVFGGDINQSYCLSLSNGTEVFIKCNRLENLSFFRAEAAGLQAIRQTGTIRVPQVFGIGIDETRQISFLLLEYLKAAPKIDTYWETFGRELAMLHQASVSADREQRFGFWMDNYIGASVQVNTPRQSWIAFFRECRLLPQIRMAKGYLDSRMQKQCISLLEHLDSYLTEPEFPSLLHGDLWSGNAVCGPDGKAWILDPAAYIGHFEADLAMTELFGGFTEAFYKAYDEVNPIDAGYRERKDLYHLYHLLNHLNLFGGSYWNSVRQILNRYV